MISSSSGNSDSRKDSLAAVTMTASFFLCHSHPKDPFLEEKEYLPSNSVCLVSCSWLVINSRSVQKTYKYKTWQTKRTGENWYHDRSRKDSQKEAKIKTKKRETRWETDFMTWWRRKTIWWGEAYREKKGEMQSQIIFFFFSCRQGWWRKS